MNARISVRPILLTAVLAATAAALVPSQARAISSDDPCAREAYFNEPSYGACRRAHAACRRGGTAWICRSSADRVTKRQYDNVERMLAAAERPDCRGTTVCREPGGALILPSFEPTTDPWVAFEHLGLWTDRGDHAMSLARLFGTGGEGPARLTTGESATAQAAGMERYTPGAPGELSARISNEPAAGAANPPPALPAPLRAIDAALAGWGFGDQNRRAVLRAAAGLGVDEAAGLARTILSLPGHQRYLYLLSVLRARDAASLRRLISSSARGPLAAARPDGE
ncbi:MAG: hypothetical protein HY078_05390 [Elusimicrobia bacterium]|nr:hypothetical protein [Elusimicrobiota bacterium]